MNDLIGLPQAAQLLGKSRQAVWVMYRTGKLRAAAITGTERRPRPLFKRHDIEALLAEREAVA